MAHFFRERVNPFIQFRGFHSSDFRLIDQTRAFIDEKLSKAEASKAREAYSFFWQKLAGNETIHSFYETEHLALNLIFGNFNIILH